MRLLDLEQSAPPSHFGPWRVVEDDDSDDVHIMPSFGPPHAIVPRCWCHPVSSTDQCNLVVHNVAQ